VDIFDSHLKYFAENYDVVDLETVISGRLPSRPLLITFDDAYRSVVDVAAPLLKYRGFPSVFFINSHLVNAKQLMLDNVLCLLSHEVSIQQLKAAIDPTAPEVDLFPQLFSKVLPRLGYHERLTLHSKLVGEYHIDCQKLLTDSKLYLSETDFGRMAECRMEVGNHTANHVHCRVLNPVDATEEIEGAKLSLERMSGQKVRAFSYPYGDEMDATPTVMRAIQKSGHEVAFLVHARFNSLHPGQTQWSRVSLQRQPSRDLFAELEVFPRFRLTSQRIRNFLP